MKNAYFFDFIIFFFVGKKNSPTRGLRLRGEGHFLVPHFHFLLFRSKETKTMKSAVASVVLLALFSVALSSLCPEQKTVPDFDVTKYMGQWYEIATTQLPRSTFQRNLYCIGAHYTFDAPSGLVLVNNTGHIGSPTGPPSEADGKAAQTDPTTNPGALAVTFGGPIPKNPNYFVLDTDYESYSLVGGPCKQYLWILSRTPQMDNSTYNMLVNEAADDGYKLKEIDLEHDQTQQCKSLAPY